MSHVDPSMSSGSSPGATLALALNPRHNPAADSPLIPLDVDVTKSGDCGINVFVTPKSVVVSKSQLPAILRNVVPPLRLAGTATESIIATPNRLRGVLHSDVGKRINHKGKKATIVNVHDTLRELEIDGRRFWVPRRARNRRNFKQQRIKNLYDRGVKVAFLAPCYTGDSKPDAEAVSLPPWEKAISQELYDFAKYVAELSKIGHRKPKLLSESSWSEVSWGMLMQRPTRQERNMLEMKTRQKYAALKEKLQERLLRQIFADTRLSNDKQFAVYDVMALGRPIEQVAATRHLPIGSLENAVRRITTRVNQAYQATLQERDVEIRP